MIYHLAQLNVARMMADNINDPRMASFVALLDTINSLGEQSEGFVWRLKDDETGNATSFNPWNDERLIINLTVWEGLESLKNFAFKGNHLEVMKRRREWFESFGTLSTALWWIPAGHTPSVEEAKERLTYLQEHGASEFVFDFRQSFPPPQ
jgi:hypothetical protein